MRQRQPDTRLVLARCPGAGYSSGWSRLWRGQTRGTHFASSGWQMTGVDCGSSMLDLAARCAPGRRPSKAPTTPYPVAIEGIRSAGVPRMLHIPSIPAYDAVMAHDSTLTRLASVSESQWGLITRRQAEGAGVSRPTIDRLAADGSVLERVAHGVYRLAGAPIPDHLELRAAWLQLAPEVRAWERTAHQGLVSHRSAAALYGIGHLPADRQEFTLAKRRQTRRADVRLHIRPVADTKWTEVRGLPVTRPSQIATDLLRDREDPGAVAQIVADAIRNAYDDPGTFADALRPFAAQFGLRRRDGVALLRWLLDLVGDQDTARWMEEARASADREATQEPERTTTTGAPR